MKRRGCSRLGCALGRLALVSAMVAQRRARSQRPRAGARRPNAAPVPPRPQSLARSRSRRSTARSPTSTPRRTARSASSASSGGKIAEAHARSLARGRAFYRLTRAGMLPVGGGFDELVSHALRVERSRRALAAELASESAAPRSAAAGSLATSSASHATASRSRASERRWTRRARRRGRRRAGSRPSTAPSRTSSGIDASTSRSTAATVLLRLRSRAGFASSKGRLLFPLAGRSEVRPARREGTDGPGLEISSPLGASVRAVFGGRVAFADRYGPLRPPRHPRPRRALLLRERQPRGDRRQGRRRSLGWRAPRNGRRRRSRTDALLRDPPRHADVSADPMARPLSSMPFG